MLRAATIGEWFIKIANKMRPLRPISVSRRTDTVMLFAVINFCTFPTEWAIENIENTSYMRMLNVHCSQFHNIPSNNRQSIEVGETKQKKQNRYTPENRTANNVMNLFYEYFHFSEIFCESKKRLHAEKKINVNFAIRTIAIGPESGEWNNAAQIMRMI